MLDGSQFSSLTIVDTTNLNPTFGANANPFTQFTVVGAPLPTNVVCARQVGTSCLGMPTPFTPQLGPALVGQNGAQAASDLNGAPITGLPGGLLVPVTARTDAVASRTTTGAANTTSALSLATSFKFTPLTDLSVIVDFFGLLHLLANADTLVNAIAGSVWSINITNHLTGATVFDWTPDGLAGGITGGTEQADTCDLTRSLTQFGPNANPAVFDCFAGSHYRATTDLLLAANTYDLSITHQNQANVLVQAVPEPSSILLAGFALACLGVGFRRKSESDN